MLGKRRTGLILLSGFLFFFSSVLHAEVPDGVYIARVPGRYVPSYLVISTVDQTVIIIKYALERVPRPGTRIGVRINDVIEYTTNGQRFRLQQWRDDELIIEVPLTGFTEGDQVYRPATAEEIFRMGEYGIDVLTREDLDAE